MKKPAKYNELTLSNNFLFSKVMRNKEICKKLLEIILNIKIDHLEYIEEEKVVDVSLFSKGVRLDVYTGDDAQRVYNVEMQATNPKNLPKRSRYYQGVIDLNLMEKGGEYNDLNKSYVVFICMEDIFGKGRHIYTFENICLQDKNLSLGDEAIKVFLNPLSDIDDVDKELSNFLKFLYTGKPVDDFTKLLSEQVEYAKSNEEWEVEYMYLEAEKMDARAEGRIEAIISLVKEGLLKVSDAAKHLGISEEALLHEMNKADF